MAYRDLSAALERIDRLEEALRTEAKPRRVFRWLDAIVFSLIVIAFASVILISSWLINAS